MYVTSNDDTYYDVSYGDVNTERDDNNEALPIFVAATVDGAGVADGSGQGCA